MTDKGFIHMAMTTVSADGVYGVICRCGWTSKDWADREAARSAGDKHLAEENQ